MRKCIYFFIALFSIVYAIAAAESDLVEFDYLEKTGNKSVKIVWRLEKQKDAVILSSDRSSGQTNVYKSDSSYANLQWQSKDQSQNTDFTAKREKDHILVSGLLGGEQINKKVRIDKAPWYQSLSFSLTSLAKSDNQSCLFWVLRPDDLEPVKMKARKLTVESIKAGGKSVEAQKIKVVLAGFKSMFWHGLYWYRKDDGIFMRYEGTKGPPGTPVTITTLID